MTRQEVLDILIPGVALLLTFALGVGAGRALQGDAQAASACEVMCHPSRYAVQEGVCYCEISP